MSANQLCIIFVVCMGLQLLGMVTKSTPLDDPNRKKWLKKYYDEVAGPFNILKAEMDKYIPEEIASNDYLME